MRFDSTPPRFRGLVAALLVLGLSSACSSGGFSRAEEAAYREKVAKAEALFKERCKTAGVVIHRTVKDVEGIELKKIRPVLGFGDRRYFDPMFEGAAMAGEAQGDRYVWSFLQNEARLVNSPERRGTLWPPGSPIAPGQLPHVRGYRFVEYTEGGGQLLRCKALGKPNPTNFADLMRCEPVKTATARYALDYEDIVDPEDRKLWIAGTVLKVVDLQRGEVIATYTKFIWDPGFGGSTTGRWPWQHADGMGDRNCPYTPGTPTHGDSRYFLDSVLIPKQGD